MLRSIRLPARLSVCLMTLAHKRCDLWSYKTLIGNPMLALEPTGWPPTVAEMGAYRFAANGAMSCSYCSAPARGAESVCGCVSEHISETTFLCVLPMAGARPLSNGVAICCLLPFVWMASCLHMMGHMEACRYRKEAYILKPTHQRAAPDRRRSNACDYLVQIYISRSHR